MRTLKIIFFLWIASAPCLGAPEDYDSPLRFAFELHYSPIQYTNYFVDSSTGASIAPTQTGAGFWVEWLPITQWGKVALGAGYQYVFSKMATFANGDTLNISANVVQIGVGYRLDILKNQYVVPYGRFALAFFFPHAVEVVGGLQNLLPTSTQNGKELVFGAEVLLDWIEPKSAGNLDRDFGINNLYLFVERVSFATTSSSDLSYGAWRGGFRAEF